ncbi:MAG: hypothetical protein OXT09_26260 [Myxococcales bacterium]|nr:hypothetical protein [Myxococcales bacterium]
MARSTEPDDILQPPSERVVLWYRGAPDSGEERGGEHADAVATRCEVAGGMILARVGQTIVASFDPIDLEDTIDLGLSALAELRGSEGQPAEVAATIALAVGEVRPGRGLYQGASLDRAQLLANRARPGELVIDETAHAQTEETHLCGRSVRGEGAVGLVIDARFPLKRDCRAALRHLQPAAPPGSLAATFEQLGTLTAGEGVRRVVLQSAQPFTAIDWIGRLASANPPPLFLHLGRQGGGLQPLGGISLALRRLGGALDDIELEAEARATLAAIRSGAGVSRTEAHRALSALLGAKPGAWLLLDRLRELDAPTLLVVADVLKDLSKHADPSLVLLMAVAEGEGVPSALARKGEHERLVVPRLKLADGRQVAEQILGARAGTDVARRVARLGGDTLLGVREAARTLVCAGDLVFAEGAFRWRTTPRGASMAIPTDSLMTERIHGLDGDSQRALEALCVAPPSMGMDFVRRVAEADGLDGEQVRAALATLVEEGWVNANGDLGPLAPVVRVAVRNDMPPARAAELHRFVADVLVSDGYGGESFGAALLARHLAEGGREEAAARALLDTAKAATDSGFEHMAVRLAAFALKLNDSSDMKKLARRVARTVDRRPATGKVPAAMGEEPTTQDDLSEAGAPSASSIAHNAVRSAIAAIVDGEPEDAEGFLDTAVAAGWGRAGAQRLWSLALLAKGDVPGAVRTFKQARMPEANGHTRGREALTASLILLESGEMLAAIRAALEALGAARAQQDERGARAAMHVLSACYRVLGRDQDAAAIEAAA